MSAPPGRMIPGKRLAWCCAATLPLLFLGAAGALAMFGVIGTLLVAAYLEARLLARRVPQVTRTTEPRLSLGAQSVVKLELQGHASRLVRGTLRDDVPEGFQATPAELEFSLPASSRQQLSYTLRAPRRGSYALGDVHLRLEGALGLGSVLATVPARAQVRVYPNLRGPRRYELAARLGALHSVGVRAVRRPGFGGEFEELREYVPGDPFRELDWKATAKRLRPITRVQGQEQSQTVLVALDAGRMMATQLDGLTKLDHAIHAALLLTWVALRAGDKVGLIVFAEQVHSFVPPARGQAQYARVLDALYAIEASPTFVDFRRLSEFIRARVPRRSLLVLFSDLLDESQALPLAAEARGLRGKHLPVCVTMHDPVASALALQEAVDDTDVYRRAAAADILAEREAIKAQLVKAGVALVEAGAGELSIATVNRYLEIKARHAL